MTQKPKGSSRASKPRKSATTSKSLPKADATGKLASRIIDERFRDLRTRLLNGASLALEDAVGRSRDAGRLPPDTEPRAVSYVLTAMLAHVAAHQRGLGDFGVPVDQLRTTMARIIGWAAAGEVDPRPA